MGVVSWKRILPILLIPAGCCCIILYLQNKGETKLQSTVCFGKDSKFICGMAGGLMSLLSRSKEEKTNIWASMACLEKLIM